MFSKTNQSRSNSTKRKRHYHPERPLAEHHPSLADEKSTIVTDSNSNNNKLHNKGTRVTSTNQTISQLITLITKSPLALAYYIIFSMSMFYQVMGAGVRCPKIKKHAGIKLRPINKAKDPFVPNDVLLYSCESEDFTQTIKCLDDGRWSEIPHCLDPSNNTCPELGPVPHGTYNASAPGPFKVGTVVAFRCENEILPPSMMMPFINQQQQQQQLTTTTQSLATATTLTAAAATTTTTTTTSKADVILQNASQSLAASFQPLNYANNSETVQPLRYNLTGHRVLKCQPSSKWNHPVPTCTPFYPEPPSNLPFLLTTAALILIPLLILITISRLVMKWRKRKQQQERWKQYFTDYKYRHSKTNITFGQRPEQPQAAATIPVTDL